MACMCFQSQEKTGLVTLPTSGGALGEINSAAEFPDQRLEILTLGGLETAQAVEDSGVHTLGVSHEAGRFGGKRLKHVDQGEANFQVGFHHFDANPMVRFRSVTARHARPAFPTELRLSHTRRPDEAAPIVHPAAGTQRI